MSDKDDDIMDQFVDPDDEREFSKKEKKRQDKD
jgi:hypothetical protein